MNESDLGTHQYPPAQNQALNDTRYDIIGDIHGYADVLEKLLRKLGYEKPTGVWRHPAGRKVLFLGDFIDRGPSIRRTLQIVRGMVDAGEALAVMGNHEYNALLYHTPDGSGGWLRPHVPKNVRQHAVTLAQFWDHRDEWQDYLDWFITLPLWLDLGGLRAVHANWDDRLVAAHPEWQILNSGLLHRSKHQGTPEFAHCETLLKGAEAELPSGSFLKDKESTVRTKMRLRWWLPARGKTYYELCVPLPAASDKVPHDTVPDHFEALCPGYDPDAAPLFFGHYWLPFEEQAELIAPNVACLDFSVAKDGALVGYRWDGERTLDPGKMVFAREEA